MRAIIKTEFLKIKRYHIIWAGVGLMLLSVLLTLFTSTANDGSVWTFSYLAEQVIKNNMSMIFPMCITLIAGYLVSREQTDDTLKNLLTIPVSLKRLMVGKLVVCGALSILLGLVSAIFTIIADVFVGYPGLTFSAAMYASIQITALNIFLYIAVLPIIILTSRMSNGALIGCIIAFVYGYGGMFASGNMTLANFYPITASLGLIGYRAYDAAVNWNIIHCLCSIVAVIVISAVLVMLSKNVEPKKTVKKSKKVKTKKGG